jgi:hypothetical protein
MTWHFERAAAPARWVHLMGASNMFFPYSWPDKSNGNHIAGN